MGTNCLGPSLTLANSSTLRPIRLNGLENGLDMCRPNYKRKYNPYYHPKDKSNQNPTNILVTLSPIQLFSVKDLQLKIKIQP